MTSFRSGSRSTQGAFRQAVCTAPCRSRACRPGAWLKSRRPARSAARPQRAARGQGSADRGTRADRARRRRAAHRAVRPDLPAQHLSGVIRGAGADACVRDADARARRSRSGRLLTVQPRLSPVGAARRRSAATEWMLLTSGTTGAPKLVAAHAREPHAAPLAGEPPATQRLLEHLLRYPPLWRPADFPARRAARGSLVLSDAAEPVGDFLARAGGAGVTHISGTPSHWRTALMSGAAAPITPRYVRLSGEIADQAVLDACAPPTRRPGGARVCLHRGRRGLRGAGWSAGFPAGSSGTPDRGGRAAGARRARCASARRAPRDATWVRVRRAAARCGWVRRHRRSPASSASGRYYFIGRSGGIINVGGLKVHPEEVEAVINAHPCVRMSRVQRAPQSHHRRAGDRRGGAQARRGRSTPARRACRSREISSAAAARSPAHKVPAIIQHRAVAAMSAAGKLVRPDA